MSTVVAAGLMVLCGLGVLRLLWGRYPFTEIGPVAVVALAPLLGATVISLSTTYAGVLGLSVRPWPFIAPIVLVLSVVAVVPAVALPPALRRDPPGERLTLRTAVMAADAVVLAITAVVGVVMLRGVSGQRVCCNDEYAIWAIRARTMSLAGHLDPHVFAGAQANYQHLDYPLLQPAVVSWGDGISGHLNDTAAHTLLVTLLLGGLLALGTLVNRVAGPFSGVVATLLAAGTAGMMGFATLLMADVPLAAMSIALFGAALLWLAHPDRRSLAMVTVLAAGVAATKVEGALFALSILVAIVSVSRGRRREPIVAAGIVVATMLPWLVWTRAHHIKSDLVNGTTLSVHHLRRVVPQSGNVVRLMVRYWPGYGWLAVAAALTAALLAWQLAPEHRRLVGFLAIAWTLATAGMWAQYVISAGQHTPAGQPILPGLKLHFASSAPRVLIVPSLLLTLMTPVLAGTVLWRGLNQADRNASPATANAVASASRHGSIGVSPAARQAASDSTE